jgi:hypothetical protein
MHSSIFKEIDKFNLSTSFNVSQISKNQTEITCIKTETGCWAKLFS